MSSLNQAINDAQKVMVANNLPQATIWKTNQSFGFNFDNQPIGTTINDYGVTRTAVYVVFNGKGE